MANFKKSGGELRSIKAEMEPELRAWAEAFAHKTGRTLSEVIRLALRELRAEVGEVDPNAGKRSALRAKELDPVDQVKANILREHDHLARKHPRTK